MFALEIFADQNPILGVRPRIEVFKENDPPGLKII
jgi:hypothetical protein